MKSPKQCNPVTGSNTTTLAATLAATLLMLTMSGCSGPLWQFPGGALEGPEQRIDLATLSPDGGVMQLETNPDDPYSVNVGYVVIDSNMYIDPADSRAWYQNMKANPAVRIRFDGAEVIHPMTAVNESNPAVLKEFEADRIVLRLMPR